MHSRYAHLLSGCTCRPYLSSVADSVVLCVVTTHDVLCARRDRHVYHISPAIRVQGYFFVFRLEKSHPAESRVGAKCECVSGGGTKIYA